jgi:hypothetical protein
MDRSTAPISQDQWTRVVVLAPAPAPSPSANLGATSLSPQVQTQFEQRDWFAIEHHDPYLAMAELCLRERAQAARAAWGLQRMERMALVILHPEHWPAEMLDDLIQAVRACLSDITVYAVRDDRVEPVGQPAASGRRAPEASAAKVDGVGKVLNVADRSNAARPRAAPSLADDESSRLTRDEIDMLLRAGEAAQ